MIIRNDEEQGNIVQEMMGKENKQTIPVLNNQNIVRNDGETPNIIEEMMNEDEQIKFRDLQFEFVGNYIDEKDNLPLQEWLEKNLHKHLPEKTTEEVGTISKEIIESLKKTEEMKVSLEKAIETGRSKESWIAARLQESASQMSVEDSAIYLQNLDDAVKQANEAMLDTITTNAGIPNQNPNLDGFIAEQHHVNSFNMNATAKGESYVAEVLKPKTGETFHKNSVDIVIKDASGNTVHRYQAKYGATAEDTIKLIEKGDYRGQQILVPEEQVEEVQKAFPKRKVSSAISVGDVKSKPLTKQEAKDLQKKSQKGNFMEADWNDYKVKDVSIGIAKQASLAAVQGAAISTGVMVATKWLKGEEIKKKEVLETALKTGADIGVKAAAAGALKVAVEKGICRRIPKNVPGATYANIAFVAVENAKVASKIFTGEMTIKEGVEQMERTTGSCVAGIAASGEGATIGTAIGSVLGPVGAALGGAIGGGIGYMAGSKVGEAIVTGAQKVRNAVVKAVKAVAKEVKKAVKTAAEWVGSKLLDLIF